MLVRPVRTFVAKMTVPSMGDVLHQTLVSVSKGGRAQSAANLSVVLSNVRAMALAQLQEHVIAKWVGQLGIVLSQYHAPTIALDMDSATKDSAGVRPTGCRLIALCSRQNHVWKVRTNAMEGVCVGARANVRVRLDLLVGSVNAMRFVQMVALVEANAWTTAFANAFRHSQATFASMMWRKTHSLVLSARTTAAARVTATERCVAVSWGLVGPIVRRSNRLSVLMLAITKVSVRSTKTARPRVVRARRAGPGPLVRSLMKAVPMLALARARVSTINALVALDGAGQTAP
eukprot:c27914_g1_i1.p2 GENE.c27914_g1_i1~~c27914_g1_i1.p2  ORF type:complete len:289 (+),score=26.09 c27914_g1_i1:67-933(+)